MIKSELLTRGVDKILPDSKTLAALMNQRPITLYQGIDPTGGLLHLGHSVGLRKLQAFAQAGHHVILLVGNGTVRIGDPSGRDSARPMLTDEQIQANFKTWRQQASKILDFDKIEIRYNGDWLDKLTYADIVKLLAKTTVQQLLERDMFQARLKKNLPIFGHEIIYPMLQGYDSVAMDVDLEIGGSDQTFNMLVGRDLQKVYNNHEKWVLTVPIINGLDGRKMSKSFNNFIAMDAPAREMYAKMMSATDEVIIDYFTLLTDVPTPEITTMQKEMATGANPMTYKKKLAHTLVEFYHDATAADEAADFWQRTVSEKKLPDNLPVVVVPSFSEPLQTLAKFAQPATSKSQLRRLDKQGALELLDNHILRVGKRNYYQLIVDEQKSL
ncbi:tyrosine--tRNA ligase [bacterium]|nr:tyrosine--tRNA ligase [bacterium]